MLATKGAKIRPSACGPDFSHVASAGGAVPECSISHLAGFTGRESLEERSHR